MEANELPKQYRTWLEFWQELEKSGLTNNYTVITQELRDMVIQNNEYKISYIKEQLLKELLESRAKIQEFTFYDLLTIRDVVGRNLNPMENKGLMDKIKFNLEYLYEHREA